MSLCQYIAQILLVASWSVPLPEFHRHELARMQLLRAMRREHR